MKITYRGYLYEHINGRDKILTPSTELYHGTIEDIIGNIRPGSYDNVLWFTTNTSVAQSYIPESGQYLTISASSLAKPSIQHKKIQKQLGIEYDIATEGNKITSWKTISPTEFIKFDEEDRNHYRELSNTSKELDDIKKYSNNLPIVKNPDGDFTEEDEKELDRVIEEENQLIAKYNKLRSIKVSANAKKINYVVNKLKELGYTGEPSNNDYLYELKIVDGLIAKSDYKAKGKLYVAHPKQNLKLYDISTGEPDLTDVQYHSLDTFRWAENNGYDGIVIDDFAQHRKQGNVGHISYGIFKNSIDKLSIDVIDNVSHPDTISSSPTKEYSNWKNR